MTIRHNFEIKIEKQIAKVQNSRLTRIIIVQMISQGKLTSPKNVMELENVEGILRCMGYAFDEVLFIRTSASSEYFTW